MLKIKYEAIKQILSNDKFIVITVNSDEGLTSELNNNLSNDELFNIHRKFRKKYFKRR